MGQRKKKKRTWQALKEKKEEKNSLGRDFFLYGIILRGLQQEKLVMAMWFLYVENIILIYLS